MAADMVGGIDCSLARAGAGRQRERGVAWRGATRTERHGGGDYRDRGGRRSTSTRASI